MRSTCRLLFLKGSVEHRTQCSSPVPGGPLPSASSTPARAQNPKPLSGPSCPVSPCRQLVAIFYFVIVPWQIAFERPDVSSLSLFDARLQLRGSKSIGAWFTDAPSPTAGTP